MFFLAKPDAVTIDRFLRRCEDEDFSYSEVGGSRETAPVGYTVDHNRVKIGHGDEDFERAKSAVNSWQMFGMSWVKLLPEEAHVKVGSTVAVLIKHFGFYSLNATRIVYVIDENSEKVCRYGFAYGTLTNHGESGEERFSVELHLDRGEVWYDLYAFSRPGMLLAKIGYPLTRYLQKSFARESKLAMIEAVGGGDNRI